MLNYYTKEMCGLLALMTAGKFLKRRRTKPHHYQQQYHLDCCSDNRNQYIRISKVLLKSQAHQGTSLFPSAATNQRGVSKGGQEKLRSDFQNTRSGQSSC